MPEPDLKRVDFEPYFLAWNSVLHYPNPALRPEDRQQIHGYHGNEAMIPCHRHKTCNALVLANEKYPPRVCPGCGIDTSEEVDPEATPPEIDPETGLLRHTDAYKPKLVI